MRRITRFLYLTIVLSLLNLNMIKAAFPPNVTDIKCRYNELCKKPLCFLNTVHKKISFLNIGCFFETPIEKPMLKFQALKRSGNKYRPWVIDVYEDICKILNSTGWTIITARILPILRKCRIPNTCPLKDDAGVRNCPLDLSFIPIRLPDGDYMLKSDLTGFGKNDTIFASEIYFSIKN